MTTLTLEKILDSEFNNQPATKADLRNMGMHFESQFERVDMRLVDLDTKITNLGTQFRLDLDAFQVKMDKSMNKNFRQNTVTLIGFAFTSMAILVAIPRFS
jgi:hypothetical protein